MKRILWTAIALALVVVACDDGVDEPGAPTETPVATPATTPAPTPTPSPTGPELTSCENPEGFTIEYPEEWHTNSGDVVPPCSQFNPEPFEVPRGTDERVAAITAFIDPVPFERAAGASERRDADREDMTIDDHTAVRLEYESGTNSIWPEGTPITIYMIELPPSDKGREQTLFVDTIGLSPFDYERNQEILDLIAPALEITV